MSVSGLGVLICDLDGTLIDSSSLDALRESRRWKECVRGMASTSCFADLRDVLETIKQQNVLIGIVTSSVSYYAENLLRHHSLPYDQLIAWHDAAPRKPHPAPVLACLRELGVTSDQAVAVGDSPEDAEAYRAARVLSLGAGWSPKLAKNAGWDRIIQRPDDLLSFFRTS